MPRRSNMLRELQILVLAAIGIVAIGVALWVVELIGGDPIHTTISVPSRISVDLPPGVRPDASNELNVEVVAPTTRQRVLFGLTLAPTALVLLIALLLLARTLQRARNTDPFTRQTVTGLRWIGVALCAGVPATFAEGWAQLALSSTITSDPWSATIPLPFAWVLGGFVCFAVAEIVRRGSSLREELATVI